MIFIWAFIAVAAAAVDNANGSPRIIGGSLTTINNYPSMTQIDFRNVLFFWSQNCAGTIITAKWVLTAAHCMEGLFFSPAARRARIGSSYRNEGGRIIELERVVNHPSYGEDNFEHDLSVVELSLRLTFSATVRFMRIPSSSQVIAPQTQVIHAGWGATTVGGGSWSSQLRHVPLYVIDQGICASRYLQLASNITSNMICSGVLNAGDRDTCEGDDGGPMYINNGTTLVGIMSWGHSCGHAFYPRVNTRLPPYSDWIAATVASSS